MKAFYDKKPAVFEPVGNGGYYYRWNIAEEVSNEQTQWACDEVIVYAPITVDKVKEVVINSLWANDEEKKLINDYNGVVLGLYEGEVAEKKKRAYLSFLAERDAVKNMIEDDLKDIL